MIYVESIRWCKYKKYLHQ